MNTNSIITIILLVMPLNSITYTTIDGDMIPPEYQTSFAQLAPPHQPPGNLAVPVPPNVPNVVDEGREQQRNREGLMPFICAIVCPSMVVLGIILLITNHLKL